MHIIERFSIPSINSIKINNNEHFLGLVADFRKNPILNELLPEYCRMAISWVCLKKDEQLDPHQHPESSMIIVTEGNGYTLGEKNAEIKSGDVIFVPPNHLHGFRGAAPNGFWGLSIQFEDRGLYEDPTRPKVRFTADDSCHENMRILLEKQKEKTEQYYNNPLIQLVASETPIDSQTKIYLAQCLQFWSNAFQRVLFARGAVGTQNSKFQKLTEEHILEEVGHNQGLMQLSNGLEIWDAQLASAASWFFEQMLTASEEEKIILVHFVLEASGQIFHMKAKTWFPDAPHFHLHENVDEDHFMMGVKLLEKQHLLDFSRLHTALDRGWSMMNYLSTAMANAVLLKRN